ncbi:MAG TPA: type II toxin-antitoxin system Phd/YefM family antitoxin [Thermoanaerobaculia bacterium]|nr:type II toxin-antitoxin system Phd/YefM family antitoxin [Thermoanaerobaculia bacterium]
MAKSYSIAEAKNLLGRAVHEAEEEGPVQLTRRGRPVAVLVGAADWERLAPQIPDFREAYRRFRSRFDLEELAIDPSEVFGAARDPSPGRDFSW